MSETLVYDLCEECGERPAFEPTPICANCHDENQKRSIAIATAPLEAQVKELKAENQTYKINLGGVSKQNKQLEKHIKELKEKLSLYEWKPIALVEQSGDRYPANQKFDLWINDLFLCSMLDPDSYVLSNLTWCHKEGRWFTSSDEYLTDSVYIKATHARPHPTPPSTQEGA